MKGLLANIFRDDYRSTLNVLKDVKRVTIIDKEIAELFAPSDNSPAVKIVRRNICGSEYIHAEPMEKGRYAFGGSYITSSDSRIKAINKYPIPLHDRDMTKE
jgi:hypothetical protein